MVFIGKCNSQINGHKRLLTVVRGHWRIIGIVGFEYGYIGDW